MTAQLLTLAQDICAVTNDQAVSGRGLRQLDLRIFEALGYATTVHHGRMGYAHRGDGPIKHHRGRHWSSMTSLTDNLKHAVDYLIPPGWHIAEMRDGIATNDAGDTHCTVRLWCPANHYLGDRYRARAATPALAVCASSLLAYADGAEGHKPWRPQT